MMRADAPLFWAFSALRWKLQVPLGASMTTPCPDCCMARSLLEESLQSSSSSEGGSATVHVAEWRFS